MTDTKSCRGRPKLAPEDNETRERILNTAQRLFAEKGFSKVSLRELTTAADTNLAAVNYYFGSKDKLLAALIRRAAKAVHRQRMALLDEALAIGGSVREQAVAILRALLAPAIGSDEDAQSNFLYSTLLARCMNEDAPDLSQILEKETSHLVPFAQALHELLPNLPSEDLHWRLHFILNIEHAVHTEMGRLTHMSHGLCDTRNRPLMLDKILEFVIPGLLAGAD